MVSQERGYEMNTQLSTGLMGYVVQLEKVAEQLKRGLITAPEAKSQEVAILSEVINASRTATEQLCEELGY